MPDDSNDNLDDLDLGPTRPRDDRHGRDDRDTLDSAPTLKGETILAGRYRIVRELGRGAMGTVYLAADQKLDDRPVAIKMPAAVLARNPRAVQALKEEALRAMEVVHSGVVTLRSFEETGEGVFLVMDYIEGRTLEDLLAERKTLPEDEILRLFRPIADAIDYAHTRKVIHRDVKPSNILIDKDGLPHIADFGIAREMKDTYTRTTGKTTSGTLPYMSPEQLCGQDPAPAQDIYSLAATMYECLVGHPPFYRGDLPHQIMTLAPARPDMTGPLVDAIMAGLSKQPQDRPTSCCAMIVRASGTPHPAFGHPLPQGERGKITLSLDGRGEGVRVTPSPAKPTRHLVPILAFLSILAAVGIYAWMESRTAPPPPPKPAVITPTPQPKPIETPVAPPKPAVVTPTPQPKPVETPPAPPKEITLDLGGGVTMKCVLIPAGTFMMGEGPKQHEVTISKPFYVGVTEVTQAQYEAVMGTNPSNFKDATNPVEMVSCNDATEFCKKLPEKTRQAVRLPTEAEWEYACRAGTATAFSFGDTDSALGDYAWYNANSGGTTHPVGQKKPNAWGLFDMHGNVWEWCADWYGDYPGGAVTDPTGPASGGQRVLRGGAWYYSPVHCRAAYRLGGTPGNQPQSSGFRVVVPVGGVDVK